MDPRHQKFAELLATGENNGTAYAAAYSKPKVTPSVIAAANRLAARPHIKATVQRIRETAAAQSEAQAVLSLIEKRKFLARIVRTPITELDPDAKQHLDLIKKISHKSLGSGENAETVTEIEGYCKIKAIVEDTALAGDGAEAENFRTLNALLAGIPTGGMVKPTDSM